MKRSTRSSSKVSSDFIWVEFTSVNGKPGWLYGKDPSHIAFERDNDFIMVKTNDLASLCESKVDLKNIVNSPSEALYRAYTRKGRKDVISKIKMQDLFEIKSSIMKKTGPYSTNW